ncbi:hypothetical protein ACM66B_002536 [Microbotryomycetes sp. NB124-2]
MFECLDEIRQGRANFSFSAKDWEAVAKKVDAQVPGAHAQTIKSKYSSCKPCIEAINHKRLGGSGWGWNATAHTLEASEEQWAAAIKQNSVYQAIKYNSYPYLEVATRVYGSDAATGATLSTQSRPHLTAKISPGELASSLDVESDYDESPSPSDREVS